MQPQGETDQVLVFKTSQDDAVAFQKIYRRYWHDMYVLAKRKLHAEAEAEEVVQEIFVDFWERRETLNIQNLQGYLLRAVKFNIINRIKARLIRQNYYNLHALSFEDFDHQTEEILALNDLKQAIDTAMSKLPERTQIIFRLNKIEDKTPAEIALFLKISTRTVEYHLAHSLHSIRQHIKEFQV
ncbi:MAG: RNA polymerase sigma-70 factor [Cytophagaceae bacterium]|nr:RNA polymerase sigma-70 factor [Cytophagaceae bacterium]MBK9508399.1 RNA polymerase sigma-70 factor [Cytophagaceae bacterium]MBK9932832.1 RNA polymerase sigma-70 factor [Cytophagaceae bacterium]MBL0303477.1 RNA polymerase sigma-70 factor [Cytophagaceae bacterium]MBL0326304.1 RNA polymerase sigma-70 factor [Cytophagaceae bacterium]